LVLPWSRQGTQPDQRNEAAEAEHRAILASALLTPPRRNLAELLAAMPDVGHDSDFQRPGDTAAAADVFG
jgi:plasmid stability protein